jgi:hypothetical protein
MPSFDKDGNDEWVCQKCGSICTGPSTWVEGKGNVCDGCLAKLNVQDFQASGKRPTPALLLAEHCRQESGGLTGMALDRYINRYYGNG